MGQGFGITYRMHERKKTIRVRVRPRSLGY
jgi:hypothetical protein